MDLFLSHAGLSEITGGVELYGHYLKQVFPNLLHLDYHSLRKELGESFFSGLKEPIRAKRLGEYVKKNYPEAETIFTNGMFCWNLSGARQFNICHGTYAAFAEAAVPITNPDFFRLRYIYSMFEKTCARNAIEVASNSYATASNVKRFFRLPSTVIFPPVDTSIFRRANPETARKKLGWEGRNILFVGRPERQKGFDLVESLATSHPELNFRCVLSRPYLSRLKNLHVHQPVPHDKLPTFYQAADLLLFPSRFEGFGMVTVEALACETKVLTLRTGISAELSCPNLFVAESEKALEAKFEDAISAEPVSSSKVIEKRYSLPEFKKSWFELIGT